MKPEDIIKIKEILPTSLGTDEIRDRFAGDILRRSIFSARMDSARYLMRVRDLCSQIASGAINVSTARANLLDVLSSMGHYPLDGGGIKNPASIRRLNLIVDTQRAMASSVANIASQTPSVLERYPAWALVRFVGKSQPRTDWLARWKAAAEEVAYEGVAQGTMGEMIALKNSPIWKALGNGAGGYRDTLGNPYPPFAFSSGLGWQDVSREKCVRLGLITNDEKVDAPTPSLRIGEEAVLQAKRTGFASVLKGI